jgi:hypothetical protein
MESPYDASQRRLSAEWTVLLHSILGAVQPKSLSSVEPQALAWTRIAELAAGHGVTPWFSEWLGGKGLAWGVSPEFQISVERRALVQRGQLSVRCRQFEEIAEVFQSQGIAFIPLNAIVMAKRFYSKPYRDVAAFDLLVPDSVYPPAHAALVSRKFRCTRPGRYTKGHLTVHLSADLSFEVDGETVRAPSAAFWDRARHKEGAEYELCAADCAVLATLRAARREARLEDWVDLMLCERAVVDLPATLVSTPLLDATPSQREALVSFLSEFRALMAAVEEGEIPLSAVARSLSGVLDDGLRVRPAPDSRSGWLGNLVFCLRRLAFSH